MKKLFSKVWEMRGHELRQWCFYNILLGLSPIALSWLCLAFISVHKFQEPFLNGSFLIFTATLSATSLGFFAEDSKLALPKAARVILCGLIVSLILGTGGFTALVMIKELSSKPPSPTMVIGASVLILLSATWFNLNLAAVRIVGANEDLKAELTEEPRKIAAEAKANTEVDGVRL